MTDQKKLLDYSDEYKECMANGRFILGTCFTILGFYLTFNAAFLFQVLSWKGYLIKLGISLIALVSSIGILLLQIRGRQLYFQCTARAKQIESDEPRDKERLMTLMDDPQIVHKPSKWELHTIGVYILHWLGIIIWGILTAYYLLQLLPYPYFGA